MDRGSSISLKRSFSHWWVSLIVFVAEYVEPDAHDLWGGWGISQTAGA